MRFLLAPDSFKGSLEAEQVCSIMQKVIAEIWPDAVIDSLPLADGGEGTLAACLRLTGAQSLPCWVQGPQGSPVAAAFGLSLDGRTAFVEMASASGLLLVRPSERDPMRASSYGTGELIRAALDRGVEHIVLGLGGTATSDGGAGLLQALGYRLFDAEGKDIGPGPLGLQSLVGIDAEKAHPQLSALRWTVACDVTNPLLGADGASAVFAPQKGALPAAIPLIEASLARLADVLEAERSEQVRWRPGAGAAGGTGFALMALLGVQLSSGFDVLASLAALPERLSRGAYDFILSGEGSIDAQTLSGKFLSRLAQLAAIHETPLIAFGGSIRAPLETLRDAGLKHTFSIIEGPCRVEDAMAEAPELLERAVRRVLHLICAVRSLSVKGSQP